MRNKKKPLQIHRLSLKFWDYWFVAGIAVLILLVMIVFHVYTSNAKQSQVNLVKDVMEKNAVNNKSQFELFVEEKIKTLQVLVTYPDIYEMNDEAQRHFILGRSEKYGFHHLFIMNMQGTGYYIDEGVHRNQSGEPFFYKVRNNDIYISEPFYTGDGMVLMTACVSIYDENGKKVGALCGAINLDNVQRLIDDNEMILDGNTYILDKYGKYVTSREASDVYNKISIYETPDSELSLIKDAFENKEEQKGIMVLDGVEYQTYITYLHDYNWVIVQSIASEKITERYAFLNWMQYILAFIMVMLIYCFVRIIYCWEKSNKKIYTDTLTKCNSRAACLDVLDYLEDNKNEDIMIVYMDLNRFKWVNDTYGHEKGDKLLKIFAERLMQTLGKEGFVGRMGGDEFVAVLLDTSEERFLELWHQLEEALSLQSNCLDFPYQMSSSYGYAIRKKGDTVSLHTVMQLADANMYQNKALQKSREI